MGWRGNLRTLNAMANRAAREADRAAREHQKALEAQEAAAFLQDYSRYVEGLTSVHRECSPPVNWHHVAEEVAPLRPVHTSHLERDARSQLEGFSPNVLHRTFGLEKRRLATLERRLDRAIATDAQEYDAAVSTWEKETVDWENRVNLARRVLRYDPEACKDAICSYGVFADSDSDTPSTVTSQVTLVGSGEFTMNGEVPCIEIRVFGEKLVPTETHSQLKSGKLSTKAMPKGRYWDIYLNYVASCVLRTAAEILAILPVEVVFVAAREEMLNPATGHIEPLAILSVQVPRACKERLNFHNVQAAPALTNFNHALDFRKTAGFRPIEPLQP